MKKWLVLACALAASCSRQAGVQLPEGYGFGAPAQPVDHPTFAAMDSAAVRALALRYPKASSALPPFSLTASDGAGLRLTHLEGRVVVEGPLAFTELRLSFENPEPRVREGRFKIVLPPEAAISRLAMRIGDTWQEGEVVERQKARLIYEDYLHIKQDPALLEKSAGNELDARVFPIPAHDTKDIIVSYSEPILAEHGPYRLPLKGLATVDRLEIETRVRRPASAKQPGFDVQRWTKQGYQPDRDFELALPNDSSAAHATDLLVARIKPSFAAPPAKLERLTVLVDTSASRALDLAFDVTRLWELLAALRHRQGAALKLEIVAFDQETQLVFDGEIGQLSEAERQSLLSRLPLGASNLERALAYVRQHPSPRVLLLTDAVATAGATSADELVSAVKSLRTSTRRLDIALSGGLRDPELARSLVRGTLAEDGVVMEADAPAERNAERLGRATLTGIGVSIPGASFVSPSKLDGVQDGDELMLYARRSPAPKPGKDARSWVVELSGKISQRIEIKPISAAPPLVERALARAEIAAIDRERADLDPRREMERSALRTKAVELALKHRLVTANTSLLVLESAQEYARYGLDQHGLSDILTVGPNGIEVTGRHPPELVVARAQRLVELADSQEPARKGRGIGAPAEEPPAEAAADGYGYEFSDDPTNAPRPAASALPLRARAAEESVSVPMAASADNDSDGLPDEADRVRDDAAPDFSGPPAHTGRFASVIRDLANGERERAVVFALEWVKEKPGELLGLLALGQALEQQGERVLAARAYGSIIELYSNRADMRRFAAGCLERLAQHGLPLALDSYRKANKDRPDHVTGYHLLALALARSGAFRDAVLVLEEGLRSSPRIVRSQTASDVLKRDLGLVALAWIQREPKLRGELLDRLEHWGVSLPTAPTLAFVLTWETDTNDVDLHVLDRKGGHAFYSSPELASGGTLVEDVRTGYGPELFEIPGAPAAAPYELIVHYYSRGPMGYGMGKVDIVAQGVDGTLSLDSRSFVVMNDDAFLDVGKVENALPSPRAPSRRSQALGMAR